MHLLILHQASVFGGAERTTSNLLTQLDRSLIRTLTLAGPAPLRELLPPVHDRFIDTSPLIRHGWFITPRDLAADVRATRALLRRERPDLVLGMMHYSAALAVFGARLSGRPMRAVASFRGPAYEHLRRYEQGRRRWAFLLAAIGGTARLAHRLIVPSVGTGEEARRRFLAPARRLRVILNGIDGAAVASAALEPAPGLETLPPDLPRLCVAARLSPEKDLGLLLEAWRQLQERVPAALIVIGDGPEGAALKAQAAGWGLSERAAFVGHRENVFPYIRQSDLYVHTCQFEGFGYTMLEAMACGTPVLATDCPYGPREVLGAGRHGVLSPPGDAAALAQTAAALLTDPARRQQLAESGRARAAELSIGRMARGYEAVFAELAPR